MKKLFLLLMLVAGAVDAQTFPVNNLQINGAVSGQVSGTGKVALVNGASFIGPNLGIPAQVTLTNGVGLPIGTGVVGLGSGVAAGLAQAATGTGGPVLAQAPTINNASILSENIAYANTFAPGSRAPLFIWQNPSGTVPAGYNVGEQIWIGENPVATPGANQAVAQTIGVVNGNGRSVLYGLNILMDICGPAEGCSTSAGYIDSAATGLEIDVGASASFTPLNAAFNATAGTNPVEGVQAYCGGNIYCTAAYTVWSNGSTGVNWWKEGLTISRTSQVGLHFVTISGDSVNAFQAAAIQDDSNSTNVIDVGSGTHSFYFLAPHYQVVSNGLVIMGGYNVSSLPTCGGGTQGATAWVHDAASPTYNGALSGGGTTAIPVFCNGSSWTAH